MVRKGNLLSEHMSALFFGDSFFFLLLQLHGFVITAKSASNFSMATENGVDIARDGHGA